jgi:hypothetical protein
MIVFDHALDKRGQPMIIDLASWEAGYGDGFLGRPSQCAPGLDRFRQCSATVNDKVTISADHH